MKQVKSWQRTLGLAEFCRLLGIPENDQGSLCTLHTEIIGLSARFVRETSADTSVQWTRYWWSKRRFLRSLGLPEDWAGRLAYIWVLGGTVELRFVRTEYR